MFKMEVLFIELYLEVIKNILANANAEALDDVVIIERLKSANISFIYDNIDAGDYVRSLLLKVSPKAVVDVAKELKNLSAKRGIQEICDEISLQVKKDSEPNLTEVVRKYDKLYNDQINLLCKEDVRPENIYADLPDVIEGLADDPRDPGFLAPHMPRTNSMYGSLARPGNITVICARTGVGKTTFCIDFVTKMSKEHGLPVLHFDNGEMSKLELQMRQCSAISGVPMYLIESGKWRSSSYIDPITRQEVSEEDPSKSLSSV